MNKVVRAWPLRKVISREQSFQSTVDFPEGWINETLECGHIRQERIEKYEYVSRETPRPTHAHNAKARHCQDCARATASRVRRRQNHSP